MFEFRKLGGLITSEKRQQMHATLVAKLCSYLVSFVFSSDIISVRQLATHLVNLVCLDRFSTKFGEIVGLTFGIGLVRPRGCSDCLRFEVTVFTSGHCFDPLETLSPDFLRKIRYC